ncbi:hypothetical protein GCM10010448_07170 [Streptomyces glomeratus]|uniref:Uncharacterized protein n=1 Tax=Streptomyces glomeratus TaxID=284452 RepID=A0ABP6L1P4_9ACTN
MHPAADQRFHGLAEARALLAAHQGGEWDPDVVEEDLGGPGAGLAGLVVLRPDADARAVGLDQEDRDALGAVFSTPVLPDVFRDVFRGQGAARWSQGQAG